MAVSYYILIQVARREATSAMEHLQEAESEIKSLCAMSHKMILTQEEKVFSYSVIAFMGNFIFYKLMRFTVSHLRKRWFLRDAGLLDTGACALNMVNRLLKLF